MRERPETLTGKIQKYILRAQRPVIVRSEAIFSPASDVRIQRFTDNVGDSANV
jgi:hypothetical protein